MATEGFTGRVHTTVIVEGHSDAEALHALAGTYGRDLAAAGVDVQPMGGVTNIRTVATRLHADGHRLAGLYDAPEVRFVRRGLAAAGAEVLARFMTSRSGRKERYARLLVEAHAARVRA